MDSNPKFETLLALDVGERRIGVARAHLDVRMARPLTTLENPDKFIDDIVALCQSEKAALVVIGRPRGMSGQETEQTRRIEAFGKTLEQRLDIPVYWTDEALTSAKAEAELRGRGKPYKKGDVDALAATYILDDFMTSNPEIKNA